MGWKGERGGGVDFRRQWSRGEVGEGAPEILGVILRVLLTGRRLVAILCLLRLLRTTLLLLLLLLLLMMMILGEEHRTRYLCDSS